MIRSQPKKPIRVFLTSNENDADTPFGNWALANKTMANALSTLATTTASNSAREATALITGVRFSLTRLGGSCDNTQLITKLVVMIG